MKNCFKKDTTEVDQFLQKVHLVLENGHKCRGGVFVSSMYLYV